MVLGWLSREDEVEFKEDGKVYLKKSMLNQRLPWREVLEKRNFPWLPCFVLRLAQIWHKSISVK
jgi:hypothetical protein